MYQGLGIGIGPRDLIAAVLESAHVSASLEYNGDCRPGVFFPDLPPVFVPQKPYSQKTIDTLRYMLSVDHGMGVSQENSGIIRIVGAGVPTDILKVRINHISFNTISMADQALHVVLSAPEIQSFIHTHKIGQPFDTLGAPLYEIPVPESKSAPPPRLGVPYISAELNDVTVAEALDFILKTFPGFWLYQNCENYRGQRVVYFGMFPVPGRIWLWQDQLTVVK